MYKVDYVEKHPYSITLAIFTNRARLWNLKSISNVWKGNCSVFCSITKVAEGQISLAYLVSKKHKRRDLNHLSSLIKTSKDLSDRLQVHLVYAKVISIATFHGINYEHPSMMMKLSL